MDCSCCRATLIVLIKVCSSLRQASRSSLLPARHRCQVATCLLCLLESALLGWPFFLYFAVAGEGGRSGVAVVRGRRPGL